MVKRQVLKQTHVILPCEKEYLLTYRLDFDDSDVRSVFGVTITLHKNKILCETASVLLSTDETESRGYLDLFAENSLFPCSLRDVVEDMEIGYTPAVTCMVV